MTYKKAMKKKNGAVALFGIVRCLYSKRKSTGMPPDSLSGLG